MVCVCSTVTAAILGDIQSVGSAMVQCILYSGWMVNCDPNTAVFHPPVCLLMYLCIQGCIYVLERNMNTQLASIVWVCLRIPVTNFTVKMADCDVNIRAKYGRLGRPSNQGSVTRNVA